jgi:DDE superfamily endonuclease
MQREDATTARGLKKLKDRCTLVVCANATGTHKVPCNLIGKYLQRSKTMADSVFLANKYLD